MKTFTIELTEQDISLIEEALQCWENDPSRSGLTGEMFSIMLAPRSERTELKGEMTKRMDESNRQVLQRQRRATMLKAKIYEVTARPGEFTKS